MGPENTINGSGLSDADEHSVELKQMWMTAGVKPDWIQYEFADVEKLQEMWVWNSNQLIEGVLGFGAKDVTTEYSVDGQTWTTLENVPAFAQATGSPAYTANTVVDFGGVMAKTAVDGNGASFQRRLTTTGDSANTDAPTAMLAPYWVKIDRTGDKFTAYTSPDGAAWTQLGEPQTIAMTGSVLIGLAVCGHDPAVMTGADFSDVQTTGNVTGNWQLAAIGLEQPEGNSAEAIYVTVKDSSGKSKTVVNLDTAASGRPDWQEWSIPLSDFTSAGVKMTAVDSIVIGVGNRTSPTAGGTGILYIDDVGYGRAAGQ